MHRALIIGIAVGFTLACTGGKQPSETSAPTTAEDRQAQDIAHYEALTRELELHRDRFAEEGPTELMAYGPNLFWLDYNGEWNPTLYVLDGTTEQALLVLDYDQLNYRVSEHMVVTAVPDGQDLHYQAYDLTGSSLGTTTVAAPGGGVRWLAYAADGTDVFLVDDTADTLQSFVPGGTPAVETTFTELGVDLGLFMDFDVEGDEMVFIESGRIWTADLVAGTATWLGNETQATSVDTTETHIVYGSATGLQIVDRATGQTIALADAVAGYQLNSTFTLSHLPNGGTYSLVGDVLVYHAQSGVFAYDLVTREVEPILLEPRWDGELRIVYINATATSDGVLYVKGLESESGSVGADGPIYRVEHPFLMR